MSHPSRHNQDFDPRAVSHREPARSSFDIHVVTQVPVDPPTAPRIRAHSPVVRVIRSHSPGLVPPIGAKDDESSYWDPNNPRCSLNVFCRRTRRGRYIGHQMTAIRSEHYGRKMMKEMLRREPWLVHNDRVFFRELHKAYHEKMCGGLRRFLSLKTIRTFQLVRVSARTPPLYRLNNAWTVHQRPQ